MKLKVYEHSGQVLAILFICILLLRIIYTKSSCPKEAVPDKQMLKVGYKVEDLELKVNVLTYKMQYGTWPLPHQILRSDIRKRLHNVRLTLSSPSDCNEWIKHVLLSPRRNDSCVSYRKYNYSSPRDLSELFDGKRKNSCYRHDLLAMEEKSSKTSSGRSLNSTQLETINRRNNKLTKSANLEVRYQKEEQDSSRKRNRRASNRIAAYNSNSFQIGNHSNRCKKFTKTLEECKWFLRELHRSTKSLGLICSSSDISDSSSIKNIWPIAQPLIQLQIKDEPHENMECKQEREIHIKDVGLVKNIAVREINKQWKDENYSNPSTTVSPIINFTGNNLLAPKLGAAYHANITPQQTVGNESPQVSDEIGRNKITRSSKETLHQVKQKLQSLHNVLRAYNSQNTEGNPLQSRTDNGNKIQNVCQNVVNTLVSITAEIENLNEKERRGVSFDVDTKDNSEIPWMVYNSFKQCEGGREEQTFANSNKNCSNGFPAYDQTDNHFESEEYVIAKRRRLSVDDNDIYYKHNNDTLKCYSADIFGMKDAGRKMEMNINCATDRGVAKNDVFYPFEQHSTQVDPEEDLTAISPISSLADTSRTSESDDKSTSLLIHEALQFKKALLARVELKQTFVTDSTDKRELSQAKLLDIISEEQSANSSIEKGSGTFIFRNTQNDFPSGNSKLGAEELNFIKYNELEDRNVECKDSSNSKNIIDDSGFGHFNTENENNELVLAQGSKVNFSKVLEESPNNVEMKCLAPRNLTETLNPNLVENKCTETLKDAQTEKCEKSTMCDEGCLKNCTLDHFPYEHERHAYKKQEDFPKTSNTIERMNKDIQTQEFISKDISDKSSEKQDGNQERDVNEESKFLSSEDILRTNEENNENILINISKSSVDDEKYIQKSESLNSNSNLTLKRNLGMCSLFEEKISETSIEDTIKLHQMLGNTDSIFDSTPSNSQNNSMESNLNQNYALVSANASNLDYNFNGNYKQKDSNKQTISTNTITIQKSAFVIDMQNDYSSEEKQTCDESLHSSECEPEILHCQEQPRIVKDIASVKQISTVQGKQDVSDEASLTKSSFNLFSMHSSLCSTDETSNSMVKVNNNVEIKEDKNEDSIQHRTSTVNNQIKINSPVNIAGKTALFASINYAESKCQQQICEIEKVPIRESLVDTESACNTIVLGNGISTSHIDVSNVSESSSLETPIRNSLTSKTNMTKVNYNIPPNYTSSRNLKEETFTKKTSTIRSKSQENYITRFNKSKKSNTTQNITHVKRNVSSTPTEGKNLLIENRREKECSSGNLDRKRSQSQLSFRSTRSLSQQAASKLCVRSGSLNACTNLDLLCDKNCKQGGQSRSSLSTPRLLSKSCIPILKSRLEAARRTDNEIRARSPMRGPLTVTMLWKDNQSAKNCNVTEEFIQAEGTSKSINKNMEKKSSGKVNGEPNRANTSHSVKEHINTWANEINTGADAFPQGVVIFVNIFTKDERNTTKIVDPKKFLEFVKSRESVIHNQQHTMIAKPVSDKKLVPVIREKADGTECKAVNVDTKNDTMEDIIANTNALSAISVSTNNVLSSDKLKNVCFLSVEQREIDVTAKPSVVDISTSISDLQGSSKQTSATLNKFQICEKPTELNNDEYVALLEILNHESNSVHFQQLQTLCKKIVSENQKI